MTVLLGTMAAVLLGFGDLIAGVGGRRDGSPNSPLGIAFVATAVGAVLSGLYLLVLSDDRLVGNDLYWAIGAAIPWSAARPLLYKGMATGPIVVFAPVLAVVALIVPAVLGPVFGQSLAGLEIVAVAIALPTVILLASERRLPSPADLRSSNVVGSATFVGLIIGIGSLSLSFLSESAGAFPAFVVTALGLVVIPAVGRAIGLSVRLSKVTVRVGLLVGTTSVVAVVLSTMTLQRGSAAVGAALLGLSPGVSIVLAWRFLKERLWPIQMVGMVLGALVVLLFALASA